jgi:hypothetical protein
MKTAMRGAAMTVAFVLALGTIAAASANKPPAYQGVAGATQGVVQGASKAPAASPSGSLPFTGANLAIFLVGGAALVVAGYSLNRRGKRRAAQ